MKLLKNVQKTVHSKQFQKNILVKMLFQTTNGKVVSTASFFTWLTLQKGVLVDE